MQSRILLGAATVAYAIVIGWLSLIPTTGLPLQSIGDKVQHVAAYAGLGLLAGLAIARPRIQANLLLAAVVTGYGAAIECVQPYTGRFFDWLDMLANGFGAAIGVALAMGFVRLLARQLDSIPNPAGINTDFPAPGDRTGL
jgi:VanZ family protein